LANKFATQKYGNLKFNGVLSTFTVDNRREMLYFIIPADETGGPCIHQPTTRIKEGKSEDK